jgi:hypothetical protein
MHACAPCLQVASVYGVLLACAVTGRFYLASAVMWIEARVRASMACAWPLLDVTITPAGRIERSRQQQARFGDDRRVQTAATTFDWIYPGSPGRLDCSAFRRFLHRQVTNCNALRLIKRISYSLRFILLFANTDVSITKICLDASTLAKSIMDWRDYMIFTADMHATRWYWGGAYWSARARPVESKASSGSIRKKIIFICFKNRFRKLWKRNKFVQKTWREERAKDMWICHEKR